MAPLKQRVKVTHTQMRLVSKDDEPQKWIGRTRVMFCGSEAAFEIWRQGHTIPTDAVVKHYEVKGHGTTNRETTLPIRANPINANVDDLSDSKDYGPL
jgi:hypothetical protein